MNQINFIKRNVKLLVFSSLTCVFFAAPSVLTTSGIPDTAIKNIDHSRDTNHELIQMNTQLQEMTTDGTLKENLRKNIEYWKELKTE